LSSPALATGVYSGDARIAAVPASPTWESRKMAAASAQAGTGQLPTETGFVLPRTGARKIVLPEGSAAKS